MTHTNFRRAICFATTNYDRSIELGGRLSEVSIDDGFAVCDGREIARWKGIDAGSALQLVKIHGSTDWYRGNDGHVYKLRHPMPLYGNLAVMEDEGDRPKMTSALVLPTTTSCSRSFRPTGNTRTARRASAPWTGRDAHFSRHRYTLKNMDKDLSRRRSNPTFCILGAPAPPESRPADLHRSTTIE